MAYWWVSQNKTFKQESTEGYLWAPQKDSRGNTPYHWKNMESVQPGDVIFSYVGQKIAAVSIALSAASPAVQPLSFDSAHLWEPHGLRIDLRYLVIPNPIPIRSLATAITDKLKGEYLPLDVSGSGKQAYLFHIPPEVGRELLVIVEDSIGQSVDLAVQPTPGATLLALDDRNTDREILAKSRIGQGVFRSKLLGLWGSRCCVTGCSIEPLLRASHIKPWSDSNNQERLDPFNGLLLSPVFDAAFDVGLISFNDEGSILISRSAEIDQLARVGISLDLSITGLQQRHRSYLAFHRDHVLRQSS